MLLTTPRAFLLTSTFLFVPACAFAQDQAEPASETEETREASDATSLEKLTVFGTRQLAAPDETTTNITVLSREEMDARFVTDMHELVRGEPGITVQRQTSGTDPFNTYGGFTIRGVGGNRVQMLVDGARVPERIIDGTRDYLDFNFTRQADIVRGPGSVLWGADALGGIVALETIDPEDILGGRQSGGEARTAYDSLDDELSNSLTYARRLSPELAVLGGIAYTAADEAEFSNARADGGIYGCPRNIAFGATPCNALDPTDKSSYRALGKAVYTPGADHRFEVTADYLSRDIDVQYDQVLGPVFSTMTGAPTGEFVNDYDRNLDLHRGRFAIEHEWQIGSALIDRLDWSLSYSPNGYERTGVRRAVSAAGEDIVENDYLSYSEDFFELDLQMTSLLHTGALDHVVTWGFDGEVVHTDYERIDTIRNLTTGTTTVERGGGFNFANATTTRADFYVQDEISALGGRLRVVPGVRFAHYEIDPRPDGDYQPVPGAEPRRIENSELLFSFGTIFDIDGRFSVYGGYNQGFKMPTAQQLYTSLPGAFFDLIPAPDLKPEQVDSYEIGLRGEFSRGRFSVAGFYADYTDFIQSFYNPPGTDDYTYRNLSSVEIYGIEASGAYDITDALTADVTLAWQEGTQRASSDAQETPHLVPPLTAVVGLAYAVPTYGLTLEAIGTFAADIDDTPSPDDFKPAGYGLLDLYATWKPSETATLRLGVQNVFDKRYFVPAAATYGITASSSVARTNPVELQTGAGRTFMASFAVTF